MDETRGSAPRPNPLLIAALSPGAVNDCEVHD